MRQLFLFFSARSWEIVISACYLFSTHGFVCSFCLISVTQQYSFFPDQVHSYMYTCIQQHSITAGEKISRSRLRRRFRTPHNRSYYVLWFFFFIFRLCPNGQSRESRLGARITSVGLEDNKFKRRRIPTLYFVKISVNLFVARTLRGPRLYVCKYIFMILSHGTPSIGPRFISSF